MRAAKSETQACFQPRDSNSNSNSNSNPDRPALKFYRFDPERCAFPKPRVSPLPDRPQLPTLRKRSSPSSTNNTPSHFRHFTRGRYALGEAYRLAGVGRQGALLAPAYHCVTMLDPALALDADVLLYPLNADLSPKLESLDHLLLGCKKPVKALLATHFFGFAQDLSALKAWCDRQRIVLIEDCSHLLLTENFRFDQTGVDGRFVVASPYKFFSCDDGGLLYSPGEPLPDSVATKPPGLLQEIRAIVRIIDRFRSAVPSARAIDSIDRQLLALRGTPLETGCEQIIERSQTSTQYCAAQAKTSSLRSSRLLVGHSSIADNISQRRDNYRRWAEATGKASHCRALLADLPENCAPYMFPLYIERPDPHFFWLKQLAVPVWRWDEMAVSDCPIANDYRLHLIHLPCHQSLTERQMDWMIAAVQKTLQHATPAGR
jgi:perosamine synthetase